MKKLLPFSVAFSALASTCLPVAMNAQTTSEGALSSRKNVLFIAVDDLKDALPDLRRGGAAGQDVLGADELGGLCVRLLPASRIGCHTCQPVDRNVSRPYPRMGFENIDPFTEP